MVYIIGITGSQTLTDKKAFILLMDSILANDDKTPNNTVFLIGIAKGVDTLADEYLTANGFRVIHFKSFFNYFYPKVINKETMTEMKRGYLAKDWNMVENIDELWTFWDGQSPGTEHTFKYAEKRKIPTIHWLYHPYNKDEKNSKMDNWL